MLIETMYDMGLAIRQQREKLGLTQEQLALKAGVSRSWLAKVETGKMSFDLRKVLMVLDAMGLRLEVEDA
ncbi:MAG: helix-turn-helix domain-containing protein [Bifidobacterium sp.]|uniref:helix-turn-helix domain-containing protein n=1 Tax=Bifidobacterium sp. TaxID=41200 RepID=UPI0039E97725